MPAGTLDTQPAATEPHKLEQPAPILADYPTTSHALANTDDQEALEKGAAQTDHGQEVVDLGWNAPKPDVVAPLIGGMDNEELWLLVRRFNKQIYHVKEVTQPVPGTLDLNMAEDEEFSPDKFRANLERFYMTIVIGLLATVKHIARLRSWREAKRTSGFCAAYFVAWTFDFVTPLFVVTLISLIAYPPSRHFLFPPAPIALVNSNTGGVQKPKSGVLSSHDSATGAPENHKGEAVEQEASNFVNSAASVALSSAVGKHPESDPGSNGNSTQEVAPVPNSVAVAAGDAKSAASGQKVSGKHPETQFPMEEMIWLQMKPIMHGIADVTDMWERFANALSPTPPFIRTTARLRLASVLVALLGISTVVTCYMFMKTITFGVGFGFFGDPLIQSCLSWLDLTFPNWKRLLDLRKIVPTNAQLTITLFRIGEAHKAPLPPPPAVGESPPEELASDSDQHLRIQGADYLNASPQELDDAVSTTPTHGTKSNETDSVASKAPHHGKGAKVIHVFKTATKSVVETALGADKLKAKIGLGSDHAKNRMGAVPPARSGPPMNGPVEFEGRWNGKKGRVYITVQATVPCVAFSIDHRTKLHDDGDDIHADWSIPISNIKEIKKIGGLGWKAKLVVGWALEREVADGLEITEKEGGEVRRVTALVMREELFNRLIAMGGQRWVSW